ncbi:DMT family transporter [Methanimicrococcus blatticola]|uniref:EamA domain-containing membrane protein RarD n=1 Tax=Methanimicrococcus blatticola TaxID=91560 RepID=A0A484F6F6_9EURY|nr:DMT family transporter [Methanimicrococcus blatticola]MBZ3936192.1 DMT family transporter [Methanimicrococcus blatticola]MCC2508435.1 DMT family transporter [Methanimicrococcus blatticola]TDQ70112.1 EamA domain-containing membrane protein RarD [Methanimicrococcus blatticola]
MNAKMKGAIFGILAAISYGTNPLGALFLYEEGINPDSVLFHRFLLAAILLGLIMVIQKQSFKVSKKELFVLAGLGVLFAASSLGLFMSFKYIEAGVASTILFIYPVIVAVIMAVFFKEKISLVTILSIVLALGGVVLLYGGNGGGSLNPLGVIFVLSASLTYALYIISVNKTDLHIPDLKLTFYVIVFCTVTIFIHSLTSESSHLQLLTTPKMWFWAGMLALIPTVVSLILMVKAIHLIGSTPTAIMGALEPLTAVVIGIAVFGEALTLQLIIGIILILAGVVLIVAGKSLKTDEIGSALKKYRSE